MTTDEKEVAVETTVPADEVEYDTEKGQLQRSDTQAIIRHEDPFAPRTGKTLTWQNINMVLAGTKQGYPDRKLLDDVWGEVPRKETTAIMGPSGA
jgi:hypothetical protein